MSPRQKRIVAILGVANVVLILALILLTRRSLLPADSSLPTPNSQTTASLLSATASQPRPSSTSTPTPPGAETCQWEAAQGLAQTGLDGTVTLSPDGLLRFEIVRHLAPDQAADHAAQSVWTAFDVALALQERGCAFARIEVTVLAHDGEQNSVRVDARVSAADLSAYGAGQLDEEAFIDRVTYTLSGE